MHLGLLARGPAHSFPGRRFSGTCSAQTDSHTALQTPLPSFSWQMLRLQSWHKGSSKYTSWQTIPPLHSELPWPWMVLGKRLFSDCLCQWTGKVRKALPRSQPWKAKPLSTLCLQTRSRRRHFKDFCLVACFWPYISIHQLYGFFWGGDYVYTGGILRCTHMKLHGQRTVLLLCCHLIEKACESSASWVLQKHLVFPLQMHEARRKRICFVLFLLLVFKGHI